MGNGGELAMENGSAVREADEPKRLIPRGQTLPDNVWRRRHRALVALMVAQAAGLMIFSAAQGNGTLHSIVEGAWAVPLAAVAILIERHRRAASTLVSIGLISQCAVLVHLWHGAIEAHFMFFVMIVVLSLYEDWIPFLVAAAYVVIHHGLAGAIDPATVYNHQDAIANPWKWAGIHGAFVIAAGTASVMAWGMNETVRTESRRVAEESERTRREADRLKDEFFALVSHELRTPLTSVIGYTEMLIDSDGGRLSEEGHDYVKVIRRNAQREMRLIGDLLMLVRVEAGTFELQLSPLELRPVLEESVKTAMPSARRAGVGLTLNVGELPPVLGDPERLGQAVDNLISNAIKFTPSSGNVWVRAGRLGDDLVIEVVDNGPGIPKKDQERLFDRLYRSDDAQEQNIPGTGLGLTICKAIVEAHGGRVGVESKPGTGTAFSIDLPVMAASAATNGHRANGNGHNGESAATAASDWVAT